MPNKEKKEDVKNAAIKNTAEVKPFQNLDLKNAICFGWQKSPNEKCWYNKCLFAKKFGWSKADKEGIELSLKKNVDNCYFNIVTLDFVDLDDEIHYRAEFDNEKMLWKLSIKDSPKAELEMQQIGDFFKSDLMKKSALRAADLITRAIKMYDEVLEEKLIKGFLLAVDEIKLAAILHDARTDLFMENLRTCKWTSA